MELFAAVMVRVTTVCLDMAIVRAVTAMRE